MNKVASRNKSVLKPQEDENRRGAKKGMKNSPGGKKNKDQRKLKSKVKKMPVKNHMILQEFAEYESSKQEIPIKPLPETRSNSSVIFVQTFSNHENVPIIDLTNSSSNILKGAKRCVLSGKSLQTLYKNKTINIVNSKVLSAKSKSLIAIPVKKEFREIESPCQLRKILSAPQLEPSPKQKLKVLDIPFEYMSENDSSVYNYIDLDKAELDAKDMEMIDMVMDLSKDYQSLMSMSSGDLLKLNYNKSIEEMCIDYRVNGSDGFS